MSSPFFENMGEYARKLTALALAVSAVPFFSCYRVPLWGAWLPRWMYWIPRTISGEHNVLHYAGMLGVMFAIVLFAFLVLRGFLPDIEATPYGILMLIIDVYTMGLLFDIAFGDTSKFLQGGVTSMAAVAVLTVCTLGMRQYVVLGLIGLAFLCMVNIITAESVLFLPGSIGIVLAFASVFLQCGDFKARLSECMSGLGEK